MSLEEKRLTERPKADTTTVEDLVNLVARGFIRIPTFQRGLKWEKEDVLKLYDSIYKGYPVGSLLMRKAHAPATTLQLGPLKVDAPETSEARWVVDGQQRLVALSAGLSRQGVMPQTPDDPYVVYFDAKTCTFEAPSRRDTVPSTWVPVNKLLDGSDLSEWVFTWEHGRDETLRRTVFDAGTRLREYRIPQYVVSTDDKGVLEEIFYRVNKSGKRIEWTEVHDALFGGTQGQPSTLGELADELVTLGMGRPDENQMLSCVVACQGLDVTRNVSEHYERDPGVLASGVEEALPAVRRVFSFLRRHGGIPHLRLLPRSIPLIILSRFFYLYTDPSPRTTELLVRWTWRVLLGASSLDERTLIRRGVTQIEEDEEERAVQTLLALVETDAADPYTLPDRFDARSSESRLALLGMTFLQPCHLGQKRVHVDIASEIEEHDRKAFRRVWSRGTRTSSPANRILLGGAGIARSELETYLQDDPDDDVLASHGITPEAAEALLQGDADTFMTERERVVQEAVNAMGRRLAAWGHSDRPSIDALLRRAPTS
jgi:hypothetical protein